MFAIEAEVPVSPHTFGQTSCLESKHKVLACLYCPHSYSCICKGHNLVYLEASSNRILKL